MARNSIALSWRDSHSLRRFRTGVSLHSHTSCPRESLAFLPRVLEAVPPVREILARVERRHRETSGNDLDFSRAWWTPPLSPQAACQLERRQISDRLQLEPLVSLSDHDNLDAPAHLRLLPDCSVVPYSTEWTVPYGPATFHVGVHHLPPDQAQRILAELNAFTAAPAPERLKELLSGLDAQDDTLLVLNHPLSDEGRIGNRIHEAHLEKFLDVHGRWIHALELNALQPWKDNARVAQIARGRGFPLISGGDRHGCEPNGNVNLTNAASFAEFVHEVRRDRVSHVMFLAQCREPLPLRYCESIWHILRDDRSCTGREHWSDRIYYRCDDGEARPLSAICKGPGVALFSGVLAIFGVLVTPQIRPALRMMFPPLEEAPL